MDLDRTPRLPVGFRCASVNAGLKPEAEDVALFVSDEPCAAAALFTRNHFAGAPVIVGRELVSDGALQAVIVNSRFSNAGTGADGVDDARRMGRATEDALGLVSGSVLMSSTGLIGRRLPVDRIVTALPRLVAALGHDPLQAARGMMTTDTYPKAISVRVGDATVTAVGKGAGMISPDMATMLVFLFTDARLEPSDARKLLQGAAAGTFQMLSVDTDTSTSDTCALLANGMAGFVDPGQMAGALDLVCTTMTEMLARDGEGATKLIRARVAGAVSEEDARVIARALVDSPLIKTMVYGADPNVGRILMAVGKCVGCTIQPERVDAAISGLHVIRGGAPADFDLADARHLLAADPVDLTVELGLGPYGATAYGCDLTEGYVAENAAYASS